VEIAMPALRERPEDIEPLAQHFLARHCELNGRHLETIAPDALRALEAYAWPGNIRELENTLESAVVRAGRNDTALELKHLPGNMLSAA
jgi:DNA-binding NtrC family response regulator